MTDPRSLAVEVVDALHGYTVEFSNAPNGHAADYDRVEGILRREMPELDRSSENVRKVINDVWMGAAPEGVARAAEAVEAALWERGLLVSEGAEWPAVHYLRSSFREVEALLAEVRAHHGAEEAPGACRDCRRVLDQVAESITRTLAETPASGPAVFREKDLRQLALEVVLSVSPCHGTQRAADGYVDDFLEARG